MGAFEALLELLSVHPQLPGRAPLTTGSTSGGWKVFTRSEAVAALRLMVGSSGRDPMQFALHSRRIGGATQVATQGLSDLQIQRAGRWKSRAFMTYVKEAEEGRGDLHYTRPKRRIGGSGWPYGVSVRQPRFKMERAQSGLRVSLM